MSDFFRKLAQLNQDFDKLTNQEITEQLLAANTRDAKRYQQLVVEPDQADPDVLDALINDMVLRKNIISRLLINPTLNLAQLKSDRDQAL